MLLRPRRQPAPVSRFARGVGGSSFTRVGVRDHEMAKRREFSVWLQFDAAARQRYRLAKLAAIETQFRKKEVPLGERRVAVDGSAERSVLFRCIPQLFVHFA